MMERLTAYGIRGRVDLVKLIGQFVPLERAGENWKGMCPFHTEKRGERQHLLTRQKQPSLVVNAQHNSFHCFRCSAGGDAITFVMRHNKMSFAEAITFLARRPDDERGIRLAHLC